MFFSSFVMLCKSVCVLVVCMWSDCMIVDMHAAVALKFCVSFRQSSVTDFCARACAVACVHLFYLNTRKSCQHFQVHWGQYINAFHLLSFLFPSIYFYCFSFLLLLYSIFAQRDRGIYYFKKIKKQHSTLQCTEDAND